MRSGVLLAVLIAFVSTLASCQFLGGGEPEPADSTPGLGPGGATPGTVSPVPDVVRTRTAVTARTPRVSPTPSTPTATPTVTPTPIPPSAALGPAVDGLSQQLAAFRAALNTRDVGRLSTAQLALLDEADKAEESLKDDKSRQADLVREAIDDIRAGASGQTNLLDAAARLLRQAGAGDGEGADLGTPSSLSGQPSGTDLPTLADDLRKQVDSYRQARRERNPENLLRRQKDLVDTLSRIEQATKGDNSPDARQLRTAAESLRRALSGDGRDLSDALAEAQAATGGIVPGQGGERDLLARAESLQRKASEFRAALASTDRGNLARLQKELLDEIGRVEANVRGDQSKTAETVRSSLGEIRDGASGDVAKLEGGLAKLTEVTGTSVDGQAADSTGQPMDVQRTAEVLQDKVAALNRAVQSNNTAEQLRLQRELHDEIARAEAGLQGVPSNQADALRSATEAIKNGLAGDQRKLVEAERHLRLASGRTTDGGSGPASSPASADSGPLANSLRSRLGSLEEATQRDDSDAVERAEQDLRDEADRLADALRGVQSPEADRLRAAIAAAREAAGGDPTKIEVAREMLEKARQ